MRRFEPAPPDRPCPSSGKVCRSKDRAKRDASSEARRLGHPMHSYRCASCRWWHLSHLPLGVAEQAGRYAAGRRALGLFTTEAP